MDERSVIHIDMNSFYASVECHRNPELRGKAVAVGGSVESRHGIILAKTPLAKAAGVKTGQALWEARKACPGLIIVPPNYALYMRYSAKARRIYYDYSDLVEPFGLDEAWVDITHSAKLFGGDAMLIVEEISERVKAELGLTVSAGLSWNKIFAKFGSDYKKPDAITHITRENYRDIVWPAPIRDLLYVGPATERKLLEIGIPTIGALAQAPRQEIEKLLGKVGTTLWLFANGEDTSLVKEFDPKKRDVTYDVKSVGNGLTAPHDIVSPEDANALIHLLSESVAQRLRAQGLRASVIGVGARYAVDLSGFTRQHKLARPTSLTREIAATAYKLLANNTTLDAREPLRALHVRASQLTFADEPRQLDLFGEEDSHEREVRLEETIDSLRRRFGNHAVRRACELVDPAMRDLDIAHDNVVHPVSFFTGGEGA